MCARPTLCLVATTLLLLAGTLVAWVDLAGACSCKGTDPRDRLAAGDAALIGLVVAKRPQRTTPLGDPGFEYTVRIARRFNAEFAAEVKITAGRASITCGFEWKVGERVGAFVRPFGDGWTTNLCSLTPPTELERAASPYPPSLGRGRLALLAGGQFGNARLLALDARGRILAYGTGRGRVRQISVCPRSRRAAELVDRDGETSFAVRSTRTLRVLRVVQLPRSVVALRCANRAGDVVFAATVEHPAGSRSGRVSVLKVRKHRIATLAKRRGDRVALGRVRAYVGDPRGVLSIDFETGRALRVARLRSPQLLAESHQGHHLAASDGHELRLVDLANDRSRSARVGAAALTWLKNGRLLVRRGTRVRTYSSGLELVRRYRFFAVDSEAQLRRTLFGINRYRLVALDLRNGRRRTVATLPDPDTLHLAAVPGAPRFEPDAARRSSCAQ